MRRNEIRTIDSLLISAILHVIFVVILSSYITIDRYIPEAAINVSWVEVKEEIVNRPRMLLDQYIFKRPISPKEGPKAKFDSQFKSSDFAQVLAKAPQIVPKSVEINKRGVPAEIIPEITTDARLKPLGESSFSGPITTTPGVTVGRGAVTGRVRAGGQGGKGGLFTLEQKLEQHPELMPDDLKSPDRLAENQLGALLKGSGNDISGHIRLIRVKHGLSDWWQDPTALTGLVDWLNKNTRIRADMKVAGGVLTLDDPRIFEAPLLIMTGHDRSVTLSHNLTQPERTGGKLVDALTPAEKAGLRQYLVDKGGTLFFDDCGFNGLFADEVKNILREVLPEYSLENIPRTHEIFNCYYNLPGPPRGSEMFWGSENEGKGTVFPYLMGITIGRRLAVVYCRKDYLCAIETVEIPSHTQLRYRYSPDVYKFMTNLIVYAMKYGGMTDRSDYQ